MRNATKSLRLEMSGRDLTMSKACRPTWQALLILSKCQSTVSDCAQMLQTVSAPRPVHPPSHLDTRKQGS